MFRETCETASEMHVAQPFSVEDSNLPHHGWQVDPGKPWEMVCVVHGFSSWRTALRFEWAWQHPYTCAATFEEMLKRIWAYKPRGTKGAVRRKLCELQMLLRMPQWNQEELTVSYTRGDIYIMLLFLVMNC
jgi:hypothetical protein